MSTLRRFMTPAESYEALLRAHEQEVLINGNKFGTAPVEGSFWVKMAPEKLNQKDYKMTSKNSYVLNCYNDNMILRNSCETIYPTRAGLNKCRRDHTYHPDEPEFIVDYLEVKEFVADNLVGKYNRIVISKIVDSLEVKIESTVA